MRASRLLRQRGPSGPPPRHAQTSGQSESKTTGYLPNNVGSGTVKRGNNEKEAAKVMERRPIMKCMSEIYRC